MQLDYKFLTSSLLPSSGDRGWKIPLSGEPVMKAIFSQWRGGCSARVGALLAGRHMRTQTTGQPNMALYIRRRTPDTCMYVCIGILYVCIIYVCIYTYICTYVCVYTGCNRRNGPDFGRVFLRSNYTDITQNTYIQSSMVTEILAREV